MGGHTVFTHESDACEGWDYAVYIEGELAALAECGSRVVIKKFPEGMAEERL